MTAISVLVLSLLGFNPQNTASAQTFYSPTVWTCSASDPVNHAVGFGRGPTQDDTSSRAMSECFTGGGFQCRIDSCSRE